MVGVVGVYHHAKTGVVPVIHYGTEQSSKAGCCPAFRYTSLEVDKAQELLKFVTQDDTKIEAMPRPLHPHMQSLDSTDTLQKIRCTVNELSRLQLSEVDDTLGVKQNADPMPLSNVLKLLFRKQSLRQHQSQQQLLRLPVFPAIPTPSGEIIPDLYQITVPGAAAITIPRTVVGGALADLSLLLDHGVEVQLSREGTTPGTFYFPEQKDDQLKYMMESPAMCKVCRMEP